ncbi:UDP-N-acetylglucosamine 2-epimerase [Pelagibacteraceae bacterium]|nr:UDP-N-acetylglucosamine 2-epimerase [Pelagibacteraceae bacterium]
MKFKVVIFSGSRSEYSLIKPILQNFKKKKIVSLYSVISNSHFQKEYGNSYNEFKKDNIKINKKIIPPKLKKNFLIENNLKIIKELSSYLKKIKPNFFIIYGDRFETFTAAYAASFLQIPIIHIEGGDITEGGAYDDIFRHSITKLSHLHITTNLTSYNNLLKLGEEKWRVKKFGLPSLDNITKIEISKFIFLKKKYNLGNSNSFIIFTIHPLSNDLQQSTKEANNSFSAILELSKTYTIIVTYPNNDYGSEYIIKKITTISKSNNPNIKIVKNLGGKDYFGFLNLSNKLDFKSICVGNSSSGIKEAKSFNCPTINIGNRQNGRMKTSAVIDCKAKKSEIIKKCVFALENNKFRNSIKKIPNPYFMTNSSLKIVNYILNSKYNLRKLLLKKIRLINEK